MPRPTSILPMFLLPAAAAAALSLLPGCVGATSTPSLSTTETAFNNPNAPSTFDVAATALRWVVRRYPPTGGDGRILHWEDLDLPAAGETYTTPDGDTITVEPRLLINLPVGTRHNIYQRVVRQVGLGAAAPTPDLVAPDGSNPALPIYHVTSVVVMGDSARVHILRPLAPSALSESGLPLYQPLTLQLRGGFRPWHVTAAGSLTMGIVEPPPIHYLPDPEPPVVP